MLMGCSQGTATEPLGDEDGNPFTTEEIENYVEDNNIEMLALLNTDDNNYAAILGEIGVYQVYKGENDEIASNVQVLTGSEDVEFGALNSVIYVVINDEDLLGKGHTLKIIYEGGEFASELFRSEQNPYVALYDSSGLVNESVGDANLFIYDSHGNEIYEDSIEG